MADFLRPEARAFLRRWREPMVAAGLAALGLWWALTEFGLLRWIGWLLVAGAAALAYAALQRLRFARGGGGAGVVTIDERRVVYFGPYSGGVADLDALLRLELEPSPGGPAQWVLTCDTGERVEIPVDAEGADRLFDVFAALPGLRPSTLLSALERPPETPVVLWRATPQRRLR
jgi:hypothetical protein